MLFTSKTKVRVRYGETDQMGYVYYGNYASFIETGRLEWLRDLGISYKQMEAEGIMLPVHTYTIKYIKPALYDDELTIVTKLKALPTVRIEFAYEIYNSDNVKIATAETTLVFVDAKTRKPIRCPDYILKQIEKKSV